MTVNLTRDGCAPTGVVSRAGDRAPETRVSLESLATCTSGRGGLPPECVDRVDALADKHGIDRDFARRLAAALHGLRGGRVMQVPGVHIETIHNPRRYTYAQIDRACAIAQRLGRGKLVLIELPKR